MDHFILNEKGEPVREPDLLTWARWFETTKDRFIKRTDVGEYYVSTVFLGSDHSFGMGSKPLLYETMSFEKKLSEGEFEGKKYPYHADLQIDGSSNRYSTREEALKGHEEIVKIVEQHDKR